MLGEVLLQLNIKTNNMAQQTAVEWLKDKLKETYDKEGKLPLAYTLHLVEQAKQMEKEQIIEAATRWKGTDFAEQYYNEQYGQGSPDTNTSQSS